METKTSKAQQKAVNKYVKNNYDRFVLNMPKGEKEKIKAHASKQSESLNGFINRAISETMERDEERRCSPYAIIK
jgi:predicted HicB family RNase H-like nuclease